MICPYIRSSGLGSYKYCEMSHFLTYNLGYQQTPNVKTVLGTTAHKVLECLAIGKKYLQENPKSKTIIIQDENFGKLEYSLDDFFEVTELSSIEIKKINSSRVNKDVYKHPVFLEEGALRIGTKCVDNLLERSIDLYEDNRWQPIDRKHAANFTWMALEHANGEYDPRKREIFFPEKQFDFELTRDWSSYEFEIGNELYRGNLAIKGTIDLITKINNNTLEIIDWKTGQRKDWGTGEIKDYEYLKKDPQLMLYYYAARKLFPEFDNIFVTIFFIRDGGPFTLCFDTNDMDKVEENLKQHFLSVSANTRPKLRSPDHSDFQCHRLCHFYKNNYPGTNQNICRFIHNEINRIGMDEVINQYAAEGFDPGKYNAPGEVKD